MVKMSIWALVSWDWWWDSLKIVFSNLSIYMTMRLC